MKDVDLKYYYYDYMRKSMTIVRHAFFIGQKGILGGFKELIMVRILY
jgi:hypothetical protein